MGKVMVIMGSASDRDKMEAAIGRLIDGHVDIEAHILSAHRTPHELREIVERSDADVIIAGAGMSAGLPGQVAALTTRPVIGVPLSGGLLGGLDALFAVTQMPPGVPVATVAIDGAKNAAILALQIIGVHDHTVEGNIIAERKRNHDKVLESDQAWNAEVSERKVSSWLKKGNAPKKDSKIIIS